MECVSRLLLPYLWNQQHTHVPSHRHAKVVHPCNARGALSNQYSSLKRRYDQGLDKRGATCEAPLHFLPYAQLEETLFCVAAKLPLHGREMPWRSRRRAAHHLAEAPSRVGSRDRLELLVMNGARPPDSGESFCRTECKVVLGRQQWQQQARQQLSGHLALSLEKDASWPIAGLPETAVQLSEDIHAAAGRRPFLAVEIYI